MSNLVSDHYDYTVDPRCKCRGNELCAPCEDAAVEAREAQIAKLRAALITFAEQMPGQMWDYAVTATMSALVRSLSLDGRCKLCGCYNECAPGCAATLLAEAID